MWKNRLLVATEKFQHPAWGVSHSQRVYELSLQLAAEQGVDADQDALFVAAYLHDMGAFEPYKQPGVDHAERSVQVIGELFDSVDFPLDRASLVKDIIRGHMFYANPAPQIEAVIFHDADVLDFMGAIGVARLLSIVGLDDWTPDLKSAIELIQRFSQELPGKLHTTQAQQMGEVRRAEMEAFLTALSSETHDLNIL